MGAQTGQEAVSTYEQESKAHFLGWPMEALENVYKVACFLPIKGGEAGMRAIVKHSCAFRKEVKLKHEKCGSFTFLYSIRKIFSWNIIGFKENFSITSLYFAFFP